MMNKGEHDGNVRGQATGETKTAETGRQQNEAHAQEVTREQVRVIAEAIRERRAELLARDVLTQDEVNEMNWLNRAARDRPYPELTCGAPGANHQRSAAQRRPPGCTIIKGNKVTHPRHWNRSQVRVAVKRDKLFKKYRKKAKVR